MSSLLLLLRSFVWLEGGERLGRRRLVGGGGDRKGGCGRGRGRRRFTLSVAAATVVRLFDRRLARSGGFGRLGRLALSATEFSASVRKPHRKQASNYNSNTRIISDQTYLDSRLGQLRLTCERLAFGRIGIRSY